MFSNAKFPDTFYVEIKSWSLTSLIDQKYTHIAVNKNNEKTKFLYDIICNYILDYTKIKMITDIRALSILGETLGTNNYLICINIEYKVPPDPYSISIPLTIKDNKKVIKIIKDSSCLVSLNESLDYKKLKEFCKLFKDNLKQIANNYYAIEAYYENNKISSIPYRGTTNKYYNMAVEKFFRILDNLRIDIESADKELGTIEYIIEENKVD